MTYLPSAGQSQSTVEGFPLDLQPPVAQPPCLTRHSFVLPPFFLSHLIPSTAAFFFCLPACLLPLRSLLVPSSTFYRFTYICSPRLYLPTKLLILPFCGSRNSSPFSFPVQPRSYVHLSELLAATSDPRCITTSVSELTAVRTIRFESLRTTIIKSP